MELPKIKPYEIKETDMNFAIGDVIMGVIFLTPFFWVVIKYLAGWSRIGWFCWLIMSMVYYLYACLYWKGKLCQNTNTKDGISE